jgi:peroxiredoxin
MSVNASHCEFGWRAEDFSLLSVDDHKHTLQSLKGNKGTVIVFICNHCPYVIAIADRLSFESKELKKIGVNTIAIMSNDVKSYPEDSFENMKKFSKKYNFEFPYLYDSTQEVAKKFKAVCTPDFFGFNKKLELLYRGRIDSGIMNNNEKEISRELFNAMEMISLTNQGPIKQMNSFGCSIKWQNNE